MECNVFKCYGGWERLRIMNWKDMKNWWGKENRIVLKVYIVER